MSGANVVDSSGWLEYFADTDRAAFFAPALEDAEHLIVPVICVYEVVKKVLRERGEEAAWQVASAMQSGTVVEADGELALEAARLGLPLADSLILATARRHQALLWTQDEHFRGFPEARFPTAG